MRVLLVEDDHVLGEALRDHVAAAGHAVDWFKLLDDATAATLTMAYGLILLDMRLPDGDGITLLQSLRNRDDSTPVIILTAHDQVSDRIAGLNAGADDYLVKPFDLNELSARMLAVSRRYEGRSAPVIRLPGIEINQVARNIVVDGTAQTLSAREWAVLEKLVEHPGAVVSKSQLHDTLYEFGAEIESNTVEVYISRLRKKIGHDRVETVRGVGYTIR
ncbi:MULTISPECIES: response regulator transcription factor [Rhizobium/Agrobacterium group]|uniref:DNA-binding response regulator n=2 Tax=Rhizobium/Agrobacterium group TaxID=227290 RepID=A0A1B9TZN7_AGRTU|nr:MULTISPECIES: response regulator transcription factor [Rhizobium/Agrobacterium group]AHK03813.1 two-component system response regulator QseB [Agrobacterium tumefaciens LBA4213 (Ach5)]AKC09572.1 two component response regulator [Agrobacterium tumefaciens]EHJ95935.1 two component response regulator [Agrobacterium tumefaciens 5A]MDP9562868.1 DNA-binding response OmpR family regulator [Rhizobium nepotum]ADY67115.1 two component response regulator [Agrobacterium tumefaciens]